MITIKVAAGALLHKLAENREKHVAEFEAQRKGYRKAYVKTLKEAIKAAESGGTIERYPGQSLPVPESHERDYSVAVEMVKQIDAEELVELTETDFKRLWLDEWDWKPMHAMNGISYVGDHGHYPE